MNERNGLRSTQARRILWRAWRQVFAALCLGVFMASARAAADPLVVVLDFVVPTHKAGAKYRTPATIDTALAADLARRLGRPLAAVNSGPADAVITTLEPATTPPTSMAVIALPYRAAPMAIMRTDSDIRRWEDLRNRKVCVAAGGTHVGDLRDRYAAIEVLHPTLTEALVALRIGDCDVLVHDSALLEELLRLPEWKKFSRRLPTRPRRTLAVLVPRDDGEGAGRIRSIVSDWKATSFPESLVKDAVRDIAFEVYVEQEVPDCH